MKINNLISIIVTIYKNYNFLDNLINSVESQTYSNYELIFVNDGSDIKVSEYLDSYNFLYPNKVRIFNIERVYRSASLNYGISKSKSDIICILDSDDYWHKRKLEIQYYYLNKLNLKFLATSSIIFYNSDIEKIANTKSLINLKKIKKNSFYYTNKIPHSSIMAFKKYLNYNENLYQNVDLDLWLKISNKIELYKLNLPLTYIRRHENQFFYGNTIAKRILYFKNSYFVRTNYTTSIYNKFLIIVFIIKFLLSILRFLIGKFK